MVLLFILIVEFNLMPYLIDIKSFVIMINIIRLIIIIYLIWHGLKEWDLTWPQFLKSFIGMIHIIKVIIYLIWHSNYKEFNLTNFVDIKSFIRMIHIIR